MSDSPEPALERSLYYGMLFQFALWTLELYLYAGTVYRFFTKESSRDRKRARMYYTIAGGVILALLTVEVFANVVLLEFMWIDHRDFPGGPLGFFTVGSSAWWEIFGTATDMVANFIGDGILVYRCWAVWEANWIVMAGMVLLYLSSIAMALISLVQSALPGSQFFSGKTVNFGVPWTALSVSLNVFLTALIIYRIWYVRDTFRRISQTRPLSAYTGLAAVFYESSLPFSVLGIVYAITYGREVQEAPFFSFVWGTLVGLSPQIIIYRVASGSAFTSRSSAECETIASHIELVSRHGAELPTHIQDDAGSTSKSV